MNNKNLYIVKLTFQSQNTTVLPFTLFPNKQSPGDWYFDSHVDIESDIELTQLSEASNF